MKWKIDYNTNNDVIDTQHKELVRIVNELENSLTREDKNIPQNISSVLKCVRYCIELKENFLKDSACNESDKQSRYYCESFNEIFDFFISAQVSEREKVNFIVEWVERHLLNEKIHFSAIIENNTLPKDYKKINLRNERVLLNGKYEKLKYLQAKKLIDTNDFKINKAKVVIEYLFSHGLQNFSAAYNELEDLFKSNIISETEKAEYLASFLKKAGTKDALSKINDIDGKLRYLIALNQSNLISDEKFEEIKMNVLKTYLETSTTDANSQDGKDKENTTLLTDNRSKDTPKELTKTNKQTDKQDE